LACLKDSEWVEAWAEWEVAWAEWEVAVCQKEWEVHQWEEEWEMEEVVNLRKDNHSGKVGFKDQARTLVQAVEVQAQAKQAANIKEQVVKEVKVEKEVAEEVIHLVMYLKQTEE